MKKIMSIIAKSFACLLVVAFCGGMGIRWMLYSDLNEFEHMTYENPTEAADMNRTLIRLRRHNTKIYLDFLIPDEVNTIELKRPQLCLLMTPGEITPLKVLQADYCRSINILQVAFQNGLLLKEDLEKIEKDLKIYSVWRPVKFFISVSRSLGENIKFSEKQWKRLDDAIDTTNAGGIIIDNRCLWCAQIRLLEILEEEGYITHECGQRIIDICWGRQ